MIGSDRSLDDKINVFMNRKAGEFPELDLLEEEKISGSRLRPMFNKYIGG